MMRTSFADLKYRNKLLKDMLNKGPAEPSHVNARIFFVFFGTTFTVNIKIYVKPADHI